MAEKKSTVTFTGLRKEIQNRKFRPIYVLQGEETYYIDRLEELITEAAITEDERSFNYSLYYGSDAEVRKVISTCMEYPTFAEHRVVVLREAQNIAKQPGHKDDLDLFATYAQRPAPQTILIICNKGGAIKSKALTDMLKSGDQGIVFSSARVRDLRPVINDYVTSMGCHIDEKSASMMADNVGNDLSRLFGELDKLQLLVGDDKRITPELIERNIGISKDFNNFELEDALRTRNATKAFTIIDYFERNPKTNPVVVTVSMLYSYFVNVLIVKTMRGKSPSEMMVATGTKSTFRVNKFLEGARAYSGRACVNIISYLRECDTRGKGIESRQNPYALLRELIFRILTAA